MIFIVLTIIMSESVDNAALEQDSTNISSHCVTSNIMKVNQNVKARSH